MFIKSMPNSHGWVHPSVVEDLWKDHFDFFYENYDNFCFPVTIHPDVSGHPHALKMLERYVLTNFPTVKTATLRLADGTKNRVIKYLLSKEGVQFVKMEDICDEFKSRESPPEGARLPEPAGSVLKK